MTIQFIAIPKLKFAYITIQSMTVHFIIIPKFASKIIHQCSCYKVCLYDNPIYSYSKVEILLYGNPV